MLGSTYDALSRLTRIAGGDVERTYAYDPQSNLLAANDNLNGEAGPDLGFTYDGENRLATASVTNLFGDGVRNNLFTYGYDALDRRASMADSFGGNTAYAYDPVDRLTQVTTPQSEVFTQSYDLAGRMLGRIAPNTTTTDRAYEDGTGRLMSQTQSASDTAFNGFIYDYTDRGNIAEIAETGTLARTKRYSYDELERLTEVDVPEAPTEAEVYTLDPEGNRLSSHLSDTGETDVANRLTGDDAYTYIYDLNGNLLTKTAKPGVTRPDWSYDYDDLDQLIAVSRDGVEVERYRYDAFGRRSMIETANDNAIFERTAIVNDGSDRTIDLVQDGAGTTQIQNRYTHGGQVDEPLSLEVFTGDGTLDQSYTYHADHLGSIRFVTDSLGEIVNAYEYDSYGRPGFELEQVSQPFRYTGREWDQATELYHYRARQYDPETGRFLQEDPIGFAAGDLNVQRYVGNNPLMYTDPSGNSAAGAAALNAHAAYSSAAGTSIGSALGCILSGVADAVALAGSDGVTGIELGGCAAQAVRDGLVAGALGAIPLPKILGAAWRANQAKAASFQAYKLAAANGSKQGAVSALVTKNGNVFFGYSSKAKGPSEAIHPVIADAWKKAGGQACKGRVCAELDALSKALRANESLLGSFSSSRAIHGVHGGALGPGVPRAPCKYCKVVLDGLGVGY